MAQNFKKGVTQHHAKAVYHPAFTAETHLARTETIVIGGRKMAIKFPTSPMLSDRRPASDKDKAAAAPKVETKVVRV